MRITVIAKGDLEDYIQKDMKRTGLSAGMTCHNLARFGMKYEEGLKLIAVFASSLRSQSADASLSGFFPITRD